MRTVSAPELAVLAGLTREVTLRLKVQNGSGTMVDMSSWLESITPDEEIDRPVSGLTFHLRRDSGTTQSLSPFRADSTLNRLDDGATYSPILDLNRVVTFEAATTAIGAYPGVGDYKLLFKGTIDLIDFEESPIAVTCRDLGAPLVDRWIESKTYYGTGPGRAIELVKQDILDIAFGAGVVPVNTIGAPAFNVITYQQQRQSISDAQQALDQLRGWDSRYWWHEGTGTFRYTFQEPPRSKTVPDYTFDPSGYFDVTALNLELLDIRNVIEVTYRDQTTKERASVTRTDATSITKYGRRFMLIEEADDSPIDTLSEATTMADAALSDLKEPKASLEIELPFFWPCQLWDLYRFTANGVHFNTDQDLAVSSFRHDFTTGSHRTFLKLRGSPAGAYLNWLGRGGTIGGGVAQPPTPIIEWKNTEVDESVWRFRFKVIAGSGGGGANISYTITSKRGSAAASTLSSGTATSLPLDLDVTRDAQLDKVVRFSVTDDATGLTVEDLITVPSIRDEVTSAGAPKRGKAYDDGIYALGATESNGSTKSSAKFKTQGSIIPAPTQKLLFSYAAGGVGAAAMWVSWSWPAFTIYNPDGTTIAVAASSGLATPVTPTLSQVAAGALGARTLYSRLGLLKNGLIYRVGAEANLSVSAGNVLKITSPSAVAGYDGYVVLVGSATNAEKLQDFVSFGTDWTEPAGGFDTTGTAYNNANWPNAVTAPDLNTNTTYYNYPWWDLATSQLLFPDGGQTVQSEVNANLQNSDQRVGLSPGAVQAITPAGGLSGSGSGGGGKYL